MSSNKKKQGRRRPKNDNYRAKVGRADQRSAPDSMIVELPFESEYTIYNNSGQKYFSYYYRINAPFDPDAVNSSKRAAFFDYWANLYSKYRVLSARIEISACSAESFPVAIYTCPANTTLTIDNAVDVVDLGEQPYAKPVMLLGGSNSMNCKSMKQNLDFGDFIGNRQSLMADDTFAANVTTTPARIIYYYIGFYTNTNFSSGVQLHFRCTMRTLFNIRYQDVPNDASRLRITDREQENHTTSDSELKVSEVITKVQLRSMSTEDKELLCNLQREGARINAMLTKLLDK